MAYSSASDVAILCPHFLNGASDFSTTSSPTLAAVNSWLSSGCAVINAKLASVGYDAIGTNSAAYEFARQANAFYGAYMAERSRLSARVNKQENTRSDQFRDDFEDMLKMLVGLDLSRMGVTRGAAPPANYAGGISISDKQEFEDDADRVAPRFGRGMFDNQETIQPDTSNADEQSRRDN